MSEARPDLQALDAGVRRALETGDEAGLRVLGYGEISAVVAWPAEEPRWACKRLPPFRDRAQLDAYRGCLEAYIAALEAGGVHVVESTFDAIDTPAGLVGYIVQPALDPDRLGPRYVAAAGDRDGQRLLEQIVAHVREAVGPRLGLDAQLSNWAVQDDGSLRYLDLTTPMLRDEAGRDRLDAELFLASLPWLLRGLVQRFMLKGILDKYFDPRGVVLDLLGNLHKERLVGLLTRAMPALSEPFDVPFTDKEARRYYQSDARTWALLQRLRKIDRWWQRKVRRRTYPFLIPDHVDR